MPVIPQQFRFVVIDCPGGDGVIHDSSYGSFEDTPPTPPTASSVDGGTGSYAINTTGTPGEEAIAFKTVSGTSVTWKAEMYDDVFDPDWATVLRTINDTGTTLVLDRITEINEGEGTRITATFGDTSVPVDNHTPEFHQESLNPSDHYPPATTGTSGTSKVPILAQLSGDEYDRADFSTLNDSEFTELLSSIEGVGVREFFILYEELKDRIPGGTLNIGFETSGDGTTDVFAAITRAVGHLKKEEIDDFRDEMRTITKQIASLTTAISNATPQSHAYLVQISTPYVEELNRRFKSVFELIVSLKIENDNLRAENDALLAEIDALKKEITQLNDLIIKLTAPPSSGFQIFPDVFTTDTRGEMWKAGDAVDIVVCGSAKYIFEAGKGFEGKFTWTQYPGTSRWRITTDPSLVSKTAYITVTALDGPTQLTSNPTEQAVFVFPGPPAPPGPLRSSLGNVLYLSYPDATTDPEDFVSAGYKDVVTTRITGGTPPYRIRINVPSGQEFFEAEMGMSDEDIGLR